MKQFKELCTPARIYFVVTVLFCLISLFNGMPFLAVAMKLFFAVIWTYILGWLCKKGLTAVSWFLVLLPFIIFLLGFFGLMHFFKMTQEKNKEQKQQQ
jgi:F0F1-type ATP synthase assembly protein I